MSQPRCLYCGSMDGCCTITSSLFPSSTFVKECKSCGRIVEELRCDVQDLFVEQARDTPLCIVTPDFSNNDAYRIPPLEDDPFENIGFITTFSAWSMELAPLYTTTTSSFCGYLAELERVLLEPASSSVAPSVISTCTGAGTSSNSIMVDNLRAYFQILEVSSLLGLDRDISDHAVQLFRDCSSTAHMRNRNVEALATAALVQASREAKEARTLQEISTAANVSQKEIHRYLKVLTDALQLSQPIDSNSISVYMPRFCSILELDKSTQDLATHIGDVVMNKSFCTRRNPISISAAAIYLSCQLEDKRKTQAEICKATALTEVTLRKVYKELMENINDLLPADYTPAVPLEKAFLVPGPNASRVPVTRGIVPGGLGSSTQPLPVVNSVKPSLGSTGLSKVHLNSNEVSPGGATTSSLAESEDIAIERSGPFDSSICMPKSFLEKSSVCSKETSLLAALASSLAAIDASSVNKSIPPQKEGIEANAKILTKVKLSTPSQQERPNSHINFFEPSVSVSSAPEITPPAGVSSLSIKDGHVVVGTLPLLDLADKDYVESSVHGRLARTKGGDGREEAGLGNKTDARKSHVFQGKQTFPSGGSKKVYSRSSVSHGLSKCLWDLNVADSTPQEAIFGLDLAGPHAESHQNSPHKKRGDPDRGDEYRRMSHNSSLLNNTSASTARFDAMQQQSTKQTSFWQNSKFHLADSISFSCANSNVATDLPTKIAGLIDAVDNDTECHPLSYLSGKVARSPSLPTTCLSTKLSEEIDLEKSCSMDEAFFRRSCDSCNSL